MKLWTNKTKEEVQNLAKLAYCNPFQPERLKIEKAILGKEFTEEHDSWHISMNPDGQRPNVRQLEFRSLDIAETTRSAIKNGASLSEEDLELYSDLVRVALYHQHHNAFDELFTATFNQKTYKTLCSSFYQSIRRGMKHFLDDLGLHKTTEEEIAHQVACAWQIRRAFQHIFTYITGASKVSTQLRVQTWQSIFSHDLKRYIRLLYRSMNDIPVLITGPSGTGKELVAQSIGLSSYIPFDTQSEQFIYNHRDCLQALNLSAISPLLIESELFGHKRGAFTGAVHDVEGWLGKTNDSACLFLDEIGDLQTNIQVKLLRVLQSRVYQEVGSTKSKLFRGRILAATHCNLPEKISTGEFRSDFYYRLCADRVQTPSLHTILQDTPSDIKRMIDFISNKLVGEHESDELSQSVMKQIKKAPLNTYQWPGNFRELEQCVKSILIRNQYDPPEQIETTNSLSSALDQVQMTADELLGLYCRNAYDKYGSYEEAAKVLRVDRRTVKSRIASLDE